MTAPIYAAALELQEHCRSQGWSFCFIGGLAVQRWGEPRFTQDVDISLQTGYHGEGPFVEELLRRFDSRIDDAAAFAQRARVVLLWATNGVPLDVALGAIPFEARMVERATDFAFDDEVMLRTCCAEDLVVLKAFADRDRDWADIRGIAMRSGARMDQALIWEELLPLLELKGSTETAKRLRGILSGSG